MIFGPSVYGHSCQFKPYFQAALLVLCYSSLPTHVIAVTLESEPGPSQSPETLCLSLANKLPYDNITTTYQQSGSDISKPDRTGCEKLIPESYTAISNICRVQVTISTSARSQVKLEAWLPDATAWHGRFLAIGNGGLTGCFFYDELNRYSGELGMAAIQTNNGHAGDTAVPMLHNEDVLIDFASRSLVVEYEVGLTVTNTYYGRKPFYKYFNGCSMGGRQGFHLAQEYPEFYDGIIAGAPALDFVTLTGYFAKLSKLMQMKTIPNDTKPVIVLADLPVITKGVVEQCDGLDGLKNGIIDDPDKCNFKPEKLQCTKPQLAKGNTTGVCLTPQQVSVVQEIFTPLRGENGQLVFSRWDPGFTSSVPYGFEYNLWWQYAVEMFQNIVYNDTSFRIENFTEADLTFARKINPGNMATWNTNLAPFRKSGGKLLSYHGTADGIIPSTNILRYYNSVKKTISPQDPNSFWKHFVIPGMDHCSGSTGGSEAPWNFGQFFAPLAGLKNDSDHKVLWALVQWVEGGQKGHASWRNGPTSIVGTKFVEDNPGKGVLAQRTYCPYPKKSVLRTKKADPTKADSWICI